MTTFLARPPVKVPTGIPGLDALTLGGFPSRRVSLVVGAPGTGKTVLACQYLAAGARATEPGVFVTFEEPAQDIAGNVASLGWPVAEWMEADLWRFVDASARDDESVVGGDFDLAPLLARILAAAEEIGAVRVVLDTPDALFGRLGNDAVIRAELRRIADAMRQAGLTTLMTTGVTEPADTSPPHGVEEFVADHVIVMRHELDEERRRRTIEVMKMRGSSHLEGRYPFTIVAGEGVTLVPMATMGGVQGSSEERVTSGAPAIDAMCGGGLFRGAVVLASGATGTGKTLLTSHFVAGAKDIGEKTLLLAYEENHDQILRNARAWGFDFASMERDGSLVIEANYPEAMSLQKHLVRVKELIEEHDPQRIAVDSLSALERGGSERSFREFVMTLTSIVKARNATAIYTNSTPSLTGGTSITETHISTLTDSIIMLRYVEMYGEMRRGLTVLKMRGSGHDKLIREFTIDGTGLNVGEAFTNVTGILTGTPVHRDLDEVERLQQLFDER